MAMYAAVVYFNVHKAFATCDSGKKKKKRSDRTAGNAVGIRTRLTPEHKSTALLLHYSSLVPTDSE